MKNLFAIFLVSILSQADASTVGPDKFGVGLMVGSMISATGKYWLAPRSAVDFGLGFASSNGTAVYADYLWHIPGIFGSGTKFGRETSSYLGGGAGLGFWSDSYDCGRWNCDRRPRSSGTGVFLRGLVGFEWYPLHTQFGVFGELGPTFLLTPSTSGSLDVGVGGRYYF